MLLTGIRRVVKCLEQLAGINRAADHFESSSTRIHSCEKHGMHSSNDTTKHISTFTYSSSAIASWENPKPIQMFIFKRYKTYKLVFAEQTWLVFSLHEGAVNASIKTT